MQQSRLIVLVLRLALHLDRLLALVALLVLLVQMAIGPLNAQEWHIGKDRLQNGRNAVVNVGVFDRIIGRASNKDGQQLHHCLHRMNVDHVLCGNGLDKVRCCCRQWCHPIVIFGQANVHR